MSINNTLTEQLNALVSDVEARFAELVTQAEDQFNQLEQLHKQRLETYAAEREAQIAAIRSAFGTG